MGEAAAARDGLPEAIRQQLRVVLGAAHRQRTARRTAALAGDGDGARQRALIQALQRQPVLRPVADGAHASALGIALASIALAVLYARPQAGDEGERVFLGHRNVLVTLAALAGAALAFERLGAYVTLGSFAAAMLLLVARTSLWRALLGAALGMVAVWLFFGIALGVRLPDGTVWEQIADAFAALPPSDQR